jgi:hypothetical protein
MAVSQMDVAADAKDRRISYLEGLVRAYGPKSLQYDIEHPNDGLNAGTEPAATTASVPECRNCNDQGFADGDGCAYCGRMGPDADATTASASDPYDAPLDIHQHIAKEILADTVRRTQTPSREAAPVAQALLLEAATFLDNSMFQSLGQAGRAEELSARIRAALAQQGASHAPAAAQSICNDARFMAALDSYMDAVTYDERNSDKRIACRKAIFGAADAWAASFANSGASHAALDDNEVARLRRVVRELGMEKEVPQDDETLRGCLFSVLGQIAYKLESRASHAANAGEDTERLDLLLNISGFHFEIIDQEFYLLNARGRIAGKGATQRDAIDAAIASSAAQEGK